MHTILIVDDMPTDRELVGKVVTSAGHNPLYAADGEEAYQRAKQMKPSLILMDVVMPNLNGYNACRKIKQDPDTAAIPVVIISSKSADSDKFWAKKQGAEDVLGKPLTPDSLLSMIRRFVR
jgi:twitching motility two-component system response regulator PilH